MNARILKVANLEQKVLFEQELSGQISDGMWENARPFDHYKDWMDVKVEVDFKNTGRNFFVRKDNYNFSNKELLRHLGERMMFHVKVAKALGAEKYEAARAAGVNLPDSIDYCKIVMERAATDVYWKEVAETYEKVGITAEIIEKAAGLKYDEYDLRYDLRSLRKIIKIRN